MNRILQKLCDTQQELEDAFRMEINYEEAKDTKDGKKLLKFLKKRRRMINGIVRKLKGEQK